MLRQLGNTGIRVNAVGYGAMQLSIDAAQRPTEEEAIALLRGIVDELGVDFIDTADAYCLDETEIGHNERLIAKALEGERRGRVTIATKGGSTRPGGAWARNGRPEHLRAACEASLRALATDRIDLYQLHAPDPSVPITDSIGTLADLQREGKINHIGVSNFTLDQLRLSMEEATIVSVQNQLSVVNRRENDELIAFCEEHAITYIPWYPVGGRTRTLAGTSAALDAVASKHAATPHAIAIAWLLHRSPVMVPIPGTRSFEHARQNMSAMEIVLSDEELATLAEG